MVRRRGALRSATGVLSGLWCFFWRRPLQAMQANDLTARAGRFGWMQCEEEWKESRKVSSPALPFVDREGIVRPVDWRATMIWQLSCRKGTRDCRSDQEPPLTMGSVVGTRAVHERMSVRLQVTLSAAKIGVRVGAVHEKARSGEICLCINRREDQGTWGLAREDARESARNHT